MENKKEVVLKKIPLKIFIDVLTNAYNNGADYIDLIGIPDEVQDNISVAIREEYFSKEEEEEEYDVDYEEEDKPLDDKDLNELI